MKTILTAEDTLSFSLRHKAMRTADANADIRKGLYELADELERMLVTYETYVKSRSLLVAASTIAQSLEKIASAKRMISELGNRYDQTVESSVRFVLVELSGIYYGMSWRSHSYEESVHSNSFNTLAMNEGLVNYSRYEHSFVDRLESYLSELYELPPGYDCVATNSGMAAFDLVLKRLIASGKAKRIYVPDYVYFESSEQIELVCGSLGAEIFRGTAKLTDNDIIAEIHRIAPSCVFLDPRTNTWFIRERNVSGIIRWLEDMAQPPTLVVDVTMMGTDVGYCFRTDTVPVFAYVSGSKYLSLWLDLNMLGAVFSRQEERESLIRFRRNSGSIPYEYSCMSFPMFGKRAYSNRLESLQTTAKSLFESLSGDPALREHFSFSYPTDSLSKFTWAIVTVNAKDRKWRTKAYYKTIIQDLVRLGDERSVPIVHGVSFWFSTTRVSASDVMSGEDDIFLRISCGLSEFYPWDSLAGIFKQALYENLPK